MRTFYNKLNQSLGDLYPKSEIRIFGNLILKKITDLSLARILADKDMVLSPEQSEEADQIIERLTNYEPIHYVLGETEFFNLKFKVNPDVLIPRPETEELVEWVSDDLKFVESSSDSAEQNMKILDIGTGCGCIPVALKKHHPKAQISAMDVSAEALVVAKENGVLNQTDVGFFQDDILNPKADERKWNFIVSNPPYIPLDEKVDIDKQVKSYEPHVALFSPTEEPLLFYHSIAKYALQHLEPDGKIYLETHKNLSRDVAMLLGEYGFKDVIIRTDMSGNERMVRAVL
jgi:release factor glutamine methyltransferase